MTATATRYTVESVLALHREAHAAGMAAGEAAIPPVMVVGSPPKSDPLGSEIDYTQKIYIDREGPCGFASIRFKGNTPFARAMKKAGLAKTSAMGGMYVWVREFGQTLVRKEAYAAAYAGVLHQHGVACWTESRMD